MQRWKSPTGRAFRRAGGRRRSAASSPVAACATPVVASNSPGAYQGTITQTSLSDDVINAVPQTMRDGSYAMGATQSETIKNVVLPAALPGVAAAMLWP